MVQKKGWNDAPLTKVWITKILAKYTQKKHALLIWDTFSGHMTDDVSALLSRNNVTSAVIPGGCTSKIQPLDVCLNKPFKGLFRNKWMDYMQQAVSEDETSCIKPATKQQVVDWVVQSSNTLGTKEEVVKKSFLVCGISNALDGTQNNLIRCSKELPDMHIAYGVTIDDDGASESDDPFNNSEHSDRASDSDDPFNSSSEDDNTE